MEQIGDGDFLSIQKDDNYYHFEAKVQHYRVRFPNPRTNRASGISLTISI